MPVPAGGIVTRQYFDMAAAKAADAGNYPPGAIAMLGSHQPGQAFQEKRSGWLSGRTAKGRMCCLLSAKPWESSRLPTTC